MKARTLEMRVLAAALLLAAAAAQAAGEFPYYPEFAEVFSQYEEVKPLLAKKYAMKTSCPGVRVGACICEPLLGRDVAGMPGSYEISLYNGDDPDIARRWNEIIKTINAGGKVSASELGEKLRFFEDDEVHWQFKSIAISAYTFGCGMLRAGGAPRALGGYNAAYEKAAATLKSRDLLFTRLMGGDVLHGRVFEFENLSGKTVAIGVAYFPSNGHATEVVDLDLLASLAKISARGLHRSVGANPARFEENRERWKRIDESIPDEVAGQELPRVPEGNVVHVEWAEP